LNVKLDENLPNFLVEIFAQHGHHAITVPEENLAGTEDEPLFEVAKAEGRLFVTLDLDFSDIRAFPPNTHPGIIVIRPSSKGARTLRFIFQRLLQQVDLETLKGALTIVDETRIRSRRSSGAKP